MLNARLIAVAGVAWVLLGWTGDPAPSFAQPAMERIEAKIRQRMLQPGGAPDSAQPAPESIPAGKVVTPPATAPARPYLGITVDDTNDRGRGVRVLQVHPGGPGAQAGLQPQDLIVAAADRRVRAVSEMAEILDVLGPGEKLVLDITRDERPKKIEVVLGQQPAATTPATSPSSPPAWKPAEPAATPATPKPPEPATSGAATKPALPDFPEIKPPQNDRARIEQLERRIEELQRRIEQLEKAQPRKSP